MSSVTLLHRSCSVRSFVVTIQVHKGVEKVVNLNLPRPRFTYSLPGYTRPTVVLGGPTKVKPTYIICL